MALVKQENDTDVMDDSDNDTWLLKWSNPEVEVKSEDIKPTIKIEVNNTESKTLFTTEFNNKFSEKTRKSRNKNGNQVHQWKEAIKIAPVSDLVTNLCMFQCPKCNGVFKCRKSFYKHLHQTKHTTVLRGSINNFLIKIVAHKCGICEKKILCDKATIQSHIKSGHKIGSLQTYCIRTGKKIVGIFLKSMLPTLISRFSNKESNVTANIGNKCTFSCLQCKYTCHPWRTMRKHIRDENHGPLLALQDYVTDTIFHKCYICKELVFCDLEFLATHQKVHHNLTIPDYKKQMVMSFNPQQDYCSKLRLPEL